MDCTWLNGLPNIPYLLRCSWGERSSFDSDNRAVVELLHDDHAARQTCGQREIAEELQISKDSAELVRYLAKVCEPKMLVVIPSLQQAVSLLCYSMDGVSILPRLCLASSWTALQPLSSSIIRWRSGQNVQTNGRVLHTESSGFICGMAAQSCQSCYTVVNPPPPHCLANDWA